MYSPFGKYDYRGIIKYYSRERKISQKDLAGWARVHTSYFSRVMKGEANFTSSQMYQIAKALGFDDERLEFCLLCVELETSTEQSHREYIKPKLKELKKKITQVKKDLKDLQKELTEKEIQIYSKEAITAKLHMYLTVDAYKNNFNQLKKELYLSEEKFKTELDKLEMLGLIKLKNNKITEVKARIHLGPDHSFSKLYHINGRLDAIHHFNHSNQKHNDSHFTISFSASDKEKELLKEKFQKFIVEAQEVVSKCEDVKKVYQLHFDLY